MLLILCHLILKHIKGETKNSYFLFFCITDTEYQKFLDMNGIIKKKKKRGIAHQLALEKWKPFIKIS